MIVLSAILAASVAAMVYLTVRCADDDKLMKDNDGWDKNVQRMQEGNVRFIIDNKLNKQAAEAAWKAGDYTEWGHKKFATVTSFIQHQYRYLGYMLFPYAVFHSALLALAVTL